MMTRSKSRKEAIIKYVFAVPVILLLIVLFSKKEALANIETEKPTTELVQPTLENLAVGEVDEMPYFPGCEEVKAADEKRNCSTKKLFEFIYTRVKYPKAAKEAGIQGKVILSFVVKKDGTIADQKVVKDIGGGCGESAMQALLASPNWIPGTKDGKAVDVEMKLPVQFKFQEDDKKIALTTGDGTVFKVVDQMPQFPGCENFDGSAMDQKKCADKKMLNFIYSNIKYPKAAREAGIQGKVIAKFVVQKDGSVANAEILRDLGGDCGDAVLEIISQMPKWIPGQHKGKTVDVEYVLPVVFRLSDDDKNNTMDKLLLKADASKSEPLIILDGNEITKGKMNNISPDDIKSINVFKGEKAVKKYGEKGRDGVIVIVSKKSHSDFEESTKEKLNRTHPIEKRNLKEEVGLTSISISPNPASDHINIEFESKVPSLTMIITDMNGKEIMRKENLDKRDSIKGINLTNTPDGIIFVSFKNGKATYTEKIVLQK